MGTKSNPGTYNCIEKAEDDEPVFVLLARDPVAPTIVRLWAHFAEVHGHHDLAKVDDAIQVAGNMDNWRAVNRPSPGPTPNALAKALLESQFAVYAFSGEAKCGLCDVEIDREDVHRGHDVNCPITLARLIMETT
jgi:hypothetical protein